MNGRRWGVALGACVLAVALPGCAAAQGASPEEPVSAVQGGSSGGSVGEDAARVDRWARERFPDRYAGLETGERLVVYRVPSAAFDEELRGLGLSTPVETRDAPYSNGTLEALAARVVADIDHWRGQGIQISSVGTRVDGTAVVVGTPQAERLAPLLAQRYGSTPPAVAERIGPIAPAN